MLFLAFLAKFIITSTERGFPPLLNATWKTYRTLPNMYDGEIFKNNEHQACSTVLNMPLRSIKNFLR